MLTLTQFKLGGVMEEVTAEQISEGWLEVGQHCGGKCRKLSKQRDHAKQKSPACTKPKRKRDYIKFGKCKDSSQLKHSKLFHSRRDWRGMETDHADTCGPWKGVLAPS